MSEPSTGSFFSNIRLKIEQYIEARLRIVQLEALEKISNLIGLAVFFAIAGAVFAIMLLSISLMAGYYFAQVFDSNFKGFALVAGFNILLFLLILITRKRIATFISDQFVKTIFKNNPNPIHTENEKS